MKKVFTLLLASALFSSLAWADYSVTAYKGTSAAVPMTLASAADWQSVLDVTPNAVAIIDYSVDNQAFAQSTKNIIVKTAYTISGKDYYSYACPNLVLTDLCNWGSKDASTAAATDFYSPVDFTATAGSYSRSLRADYNSVCVPFAIPAEMFDDHELLSFTEYKKDENNAYFVYDSKGVSAGVAVIIKPATAMDWQVTFNSTEIKGTPNAGTSFTGVFQTTASYAGCYSVNTSLTNKFSPLSGNLYPFRACFSLKGDVSVQQAAPRMVILEAGEATSLDEMNANAEDMKFFQNGRLMIRHNGQIFDAAGKIIK